MKPLGGSNGTKMAPEQREKKRTHKAGGEPRKSRNRKGARGSKVTTYTGDKSS